jgi:hypothetical protein
MAKYTVLENPTPGKKGESNYVEMDTKEGLVNKSSFTKTNEYVPKYTIVKQQSKHSVNVTKVEVVNNYKEGSDSGVSYSFYKNSYSLENINSKTRLSFDNVGTEYFTREIEPNVWSPNTSSLYFTKTKQIYELNVLTRVEINTLNSEVIFSLESPNTNEDFIVQYESRFLPRLSNDLIITFKLTTSPDTINKMFNFCVEPSSGDTVRLSKLFLNIIRYKE